MLRKRTHLRRSVLAVALSALFAVQPAVAGPYVTDPSGVRWNEVGGVRWNEIGGVRWNEIGGVRWNEIGGIRFNDVNGLLLTDSQGVRWNEIGGVRWNEVGSIEFEIATGGYDVGIGLDLLDLVAALPDSSAVNVIVTYAQLPAQQDLDALIQLGIAGGTRFRQLPMVVINATKSQIAQIATLPNVRSVFSNTSTSLFDADSAAQIGLDELQADPELTDPLAGPLTGAGVTIAVIDSGVDATHPDLPYGTKVAENVVLTGALPVGPGFQFPVYQEGLADTDTVLGHGTFVTSVAAGNGNASGGLYAGVAPDAAVLSLSAGDLFILHVLEAFDYVLDRSEFGVDVVNCSWGTQGWFDPDDPVNVATRLLHDAGITVVFAAGNHGPAPDSLNPYAVAPWVIGVGSTRPDGRLSEFSSRGIYEELLYHPTLIAPGEAIVAARAGSVQQVDGISGVADPSGGQSVPPQHAQHYTISSGTSFAAPHVAGVVALMLEAEPTLTPDQIKRTLQETATPHLLRDRSEVGAGRLDAWAAVSKTLHPDRPFGTHVPTWLDERPYAIVHQPALESQHTLPAGSTLTLPVSLLPGTTSWRVSVAWGTLPGLADVDLRVLDLAGDELARSETLNGHGLFGRLEGAHLFGEVAQSLELELFFKNGTGLFDQQVFVFEEHSVANVDGWSDVSALPAADEETITRAASRNLIVGRGDGFEPEAPLTRAELSRSLALAAGVPQRIPASRSFRDVRARDEAFPYVESVAGARADEPLMHDLGGRRFRPELAVRRIDFAQALVRAAGLAASAESRAGETLGLVDEDTIPDRLKGYAAVAMEQGLIDVVDDGTEARFEPSGRVARLEACQRLLRLVELLAAPAQLAPQAVPDRRAVGGKRNKWSRRP